MNFAINGNSYSRENVLVIAEVGTSHSGDTVKARELVSAAAEAGADCVKTQIVYADEIVHPLTGLVPLPSGDVLLYDIFKKLEQPPEFFLSLKEYAESKGLMFLATPFGPRSVACLRDLSPAAVKIASPELNYSQLLKTVSSWNLPVLLSSGVSTLADIEAALSFFGRRDLSDRHSLSEKRGPIENSSVCLMHCVTAYPAPETEYNLRLLEMLSAIFGVITGVSDHSLDARLVPLLAVACGACAVEKHFCLSRDGSGLDDPIALTPADFAEMCSAIRRAEARDSETVVSEAVREYSAEKVSLVLGDGVKRLSPSESQNYNRTNRSIHAMRDILKDEVISSENCAVLRTEKVLRPGMPPCMLEKIAGRTARRFIPAGEGIRFEDVQ
ncbi:MAG: N-acetylneuraminate synthase family protein [Spirochaetaceae bacterium]|jgi:sialic acid synthase SpsE|nr:N-acetylneuraminate synthase family protein [Spirochaetaceae bacterium]